jgi:hypothetical protein
MVQLLTLISILMAIAVRDLDGGLRRGRTSTPCRASGSS